MTDAKRVPIWGKPQGFVTVEPGATVGATFGVNLRWPNGSLVKLTDFQQTTTETGSQFSYWIQIADVPANVKAIAGLSGTGIVRKTGDGAFDVASTTTDLPEGSNLYHTTERAQDATGAAITAGTGDGVTLAYDDAGNKINATNTDKGSVAVAAHVAAVDPHPQYTTAAEAAAAAPVQSVNTKTGAVVLTAADVGADPSGTAAAAVAAHEAAANPHPQYALAAALAASTGASLVGFQQSGTGAVARTVQDKARESVSVADYATFADALAAVPAGGGRLVITPGTIIVTSDATIPSNVSLDIHKGAIISVATGITLTVLGQINAGNQEIFDGTGAVNLDNSPSEYNLAWFKTTNGYINERLDFAKRGMTSFRTKTIRIPRPYEGQAGVLKSGGRLFWQFNAPLVITDNANASTWYVEGEFSAAGDCAAFMQFDDAAKPENIYFYGPIQAVASATQTVNVGIEVLAGSRISFFGQVALNGFKTSVSLGGAGQTAGVEDIYMPRTQFSFFSVAALDIYGTSASSVQNVEIGNLRATAAQTTGLPVARLRGLLRDITIDNIYYATDTAKDGYSANAAEDVVLIESNAEGTIVHVKIGAIYQATANNGLRIQSANSNASGIVDVEVGRIFGKAAGNAAVIDYCQRVRILGVENGSDVTIGSNVGAAMLNYAGAGLRTLTNNSTSSVVNGLGRQNRGSGTPPAPTVAWPLGVLIREQGDGRIYQRVANAGSATDFVQIGGPPLATYTATNVTTDRSFDADTVAVAELADVVGTLIADLRARGVVL